MSVNARLDVRLDVSYLSMLQTSLVMLILNGIAKTKLPILAFLYSGEFVKNPNSRKSLKDKVVYFQKT